MEGRIIIYASDVHRNTNKAKLGVAAAAGALDVRCDLRLSLAWMIWIDAGDRAAFLALAREEANAF